MPKDRPLYGHLQSGNINLKHRPRVRNPDGSVSTVRSITVTGDKKQGIVLPTVVDGKVVSNDDAIKHFQRTGEHLGTFDNERDANRFAEKLHEAEARKLSRGGKVATGKDPSFSGRRPRAQTVALKNAAERRLVKRQGLDSSSTARIAKGTPPQGTPPSPTQVEHRGVSNSAKQMHKNPNRRLQMRPIPGRQREIDNKLQKAVKRRLNSPF